MSTMLRALLLVLCALVGTTFSALAQTIHPNNEHAYLTNPRQSFEEYVRGKLGVEGVPYGALAGSLMGQVVRCGDSFSYTLTTRPEYYLPAGVVPRCRDSWTATGRSFYIMEVPLHPVNHVEVKMLSGEPVSVLHAYMMHRGVDRYPSGPILSSSAAQMPNLAVTACGRVSDLGKEFLEPKGVTVLEFSYCTRTANGLPHHGFVLRIPAPMQPGKALAFLYTDTGSTMGLVGYPLVGIAREFLRIVENLRPVMGDKPVS